MRSEERARAGTELIDEEGAARTEEAVRRVGECRAATGGQRREGQPRQDIIGLFEAMRADDLLDIGGRTMNRDEAAIADILPKIFDDNLVGVDREDRKSVV